MSRHHARLPSRRWELVRRAVFERDGWRCVLCGGAGRLEADHVVPLARGGAPFDMANLQTLCRTCNIAKDRAENSREPTAAELAWRDLVDELRG